MYAGIYIEGDDHIYAAQWDDFPVDVERFEPLRRSVRQAVDGVDEGMAEEETAEVLKAAEVIEAAEAEDMIQDRKSVV